MFPSAKKVYPHVKYYKKNEFVTDDQPNVKVGDYVHHNQKGHVIIPNHCIKCLFELDHEYFVGANYFLKPIDATNINDRRELEKFYSCGIYNTTCENIRCFKLMLERNEIVPITVAEFEKEKKMAESKQKYEIPLTFMELLQQIKESENKN